MIVDDNETILRVIGKTLESVNHKVITAESGRQCLELLKNEKPDLILMDVMMPDMDGWETIEKIREDESNKDILISMLTVKSSDRDKDKSLGEVGVDWHFSKPVDAGELVKTIDTLLRMR